ncbi:hypothetical protein VTI28DRAFT_355 [Corynascus sepedonium]
MASPPLSTSTIRALAFDIFGTTVDWRTSVTAALTDAAKAKLASPSFSTLPSGTQARLRSLTLGDGGQSKTQEGGTRTEDGGWPGFAQAWRNAYSTFTRSFDAARDPWKDVDTLHRESLASLLGQWGLAGVFNEQELDKLSLAWHFLDPWADVQEGMRRFREVGGLETASLSNGNRALLENLNGHAGLVLRRLCSAEDFGAYKPSPKVYLGTCQALGLEPGQVALVAAHMGDLAAARNYGLRTIYVERPGEEEWKPDEERYLRAREWVDIWVTQGEGGFEEVARRLGC